MGNERPGEPGLSPRWRWLISTALLLHLAAVVAFPFYFASRSGRQQIGSPLPGGLLRVMQPYVDAMYLHHGYFFFAPNPGPSHLVRYRLTYEDGRTEEWTFPDLKRHWPRLLYHRHFMLSEMLHNRHVPSQPPRDIVDDPELMRRWQEDRRAYERLLNSYKEHLLHAHGATSIELWRVEHRPPDPYEAMEQGVPLNDPRLYRDLPDDGLPAQERDRGGRS